MGRRAGAFPPREAAALCKHPWLQQSPVTWDKEWGHQDAIAPRSWWAGDLHQVSTIADLLLALPSHLPQATTGCC